MIKRAITYRTVFLAFVAVYVALFFVHDTPGCPAYASGTAADEYCYLTHVHVTYSGSGTVTDQPVRVLMPAAGMINSELLDPRGWDGIAIQGAFNNELEVQQQSLTSNNAPWWFIVPSMESGVQQEIFLYSGNDEIRNDGGIYFTGNEEITVTDHADFDISGFGGNDIEILFTIENLDDTARDEIILDHHQNFFAGGYEVRFVDNGGSLELQVLLDGGTCNLAWDSAWTGSNQHFNIEYDDAAGADTFFTRNGVLEHSCDLDQGGISHNTADVWIGWGDTSSFTSLSGAVLRDVEILGGGTTAGHWGFDPNRTTETNSTNPFTGTLEDYSGNGHTASYEFDRDQTDISFEVLTTVTNSLSPEFHGDSSSNTVVDGPFPDGFEESRSASTSGLIYELVLDPLNDIATETGAPAQGVVIAFVYIVSILLAALVWKLTGGFLPAAVLTMGILPSVTVVLGWVDYWWLLIWGMTTAVTWFAQLRSQQSA